MSGFVKLLWPVYLPACPEVTGVVVWEEAQSLSIWEQTDSHSFHFRKGKKKTANAPKKPCPRINRNSLTSQSPVFISVLEMKKKKKLRSKHAGKEEAPLGVTTGNPGFGVSEVPSSLRRDCIAHFPVTDSYSFWTSILLFLEFVSFHVNEQTAARNE